MASSHFAKEISNFLVKYLSKFRTKIQPIKIYSSLKNWDNNFKVKQLSCSTKHSEHNPFAIRHEI